MAGKADEVVLLAHAADARAAVFRTPAQRRARVAVGEIVPGTRLLLHSVDGVGAELRAAESLKGQPFAFRLVDGESLDLGKFERVRGEMLAPAATPQNAVLMRVPKAPGRR